MSDEQHPNDDYIDPVGPTAGPPVPPEVDLQELARQQARDQSAATGEGGAISGPGDSVGQAGDGEPEGGNVRSGDNAPTDYSDSSKFSAEDLEKLVAERKLTPTGTGANGKVVRADNEKALADADAKAAESA